MKKITLILLSISLLGFYSCEKEVVNIANDNGPVDPTPEPSQPIEIKPVNVNEQGFSFMEKMQGQWVGTNRVIADDFDWFAWDYRAISSSQTHGIFEGGSMGNLFTDFFVTDFKNTRTIMARNGGLLNGIYRTSYFVMDSTSLNVDGEYFRFVDAVGGKNTMFLELRFVEDSLYYNAYTSRLGQNAMATRHQTFKGKKNITALAESVATSVGYPQNVVAFDFTSGIDTNNIASKKSASFLAQSDTKSVFELALESGDPYTINEQPLLGYVNLKIEKNTEIMNRDSYVYFSDQPLTDEFGYLKFENFNSVLLFSQFIPDQNEFLFTYVHPGTYYVTVIMDINQDGAPSAGDITHITKQITVDPLGQHEVTIDNINVQN
ncbi:MAG: hypothetical protein ACPGSD_15920 [Flavobacteriales bacterium]